MPMEIKITPGIPGAARVEYYACREDVEAMLAKGYTASMVYEELKEKGRLTCSYSAFCDYVRGGGKRKHSKGRKKSPVALGMPPRLTPQTGPSIITADRPKFPNPRDIDPADCF